MLTLVTIKETKYVVRGTLWRQIYLTRVRKVVREEKDEDVPQEVMPAKKFSLKELTGVSYDTKKAADEMLRADPDLQVWQFGQSIKQYSILQAIPQGEGRHVISHFQLQQIL